jgi:hypothetical protein
MQAKHISDYFEGAKILFSFFDPINYKFDYVRNKKNSLGLFKHIISRSREIREIWKIRLVRQRDINVGRQFFLFSTVIFRLKDKRPFFLRLE